MRPEEHEFSFGSRTLSALEINDYYVSRFRHVIFGKLEHSFSEGILKTIADSKKCLSFTQKSF